MIWCTCSIQFSNTLDSSNSKAGKFSNGTFRQKGHFLEVYLFIHFLKAIQIKFTDTQFLLQVIKNILPIIRIYESVGKAMYKNILQRLLDRWLSYWQLCWTISLKYTLNFVFRWIKNHLFMQKCENNLNQVMPILIIYFLLRRKIKE